MVKNFKIAGLTPNTLTEFVTVDANTDMTVFSMKIINRARQIIDFFVGLFPATLDDLSTPENLQVTPQGTPGSTTYSYRVSAINAKGETLACAKVTITNGAATLNETDYNRLTWDAVTGAAGYRVYGRTEDEEVYMAEAENSPYDDKGQDTPDEETAVPWINTTSCEARLLVDQLEEKQYGIDDTRQALTEDDRVMVAATDKVDAVASGHIMEIPST